MHTDNVATDWIPTLHDRPVALYRRHEPWLSMVPAGMWHSADAWYDRIPARHPLVLLRTHVDARLATLPSQAMAPLAQIASEGLSPQMLLRACILKSLTSMGSGQGFRELLSFNTLYRWFVAIPEGQQQVESVVRSLHRLEQNEASLVASTGLMAKLLGDADDLVRSFAHCGR